MKKFPIDLSCLTEEEISQFQEDPYTLYNGDQDVALYLRYSSTGQSDQSIEGQLRDCCAFCKANHYRIVAIYVDRATTARKDVEKRVHLMEMVADSAKQNWEYVIVWKLDRFARNRNDSAIMKMRLRKNGVKVLSATEHLTDSPESIILESVLEGMAEFFSAELSQKVTRGMRESALKCHSVGGHIPLGYKVENHKLVVDPDTAHIVQEAFSLYANGESVADICRKFNSAGYKTAKNTEFNRSSFKAMFRNTRYIGTYTYKDIVIENGIPAIIDKELFETVQRRLSKTATAPARGKAKVDYLLSGKLFCGHCGASMNGESGAGRHGKVYHYYSCYTKKRKLGCDKRPLKKDYIEGIVARDALNLLTDQLIDEIADMAIRQSEQDLINDTHIPQLTAQLSEVEKSITNITAAIEKGIASETLMNRLVQLEHEKKTISKEIKAEEKFVYRIDRDQIVFWLSQFKYGNIEDEDFRRRLIDLLVNSVTVWDEPDGYKITTAYNLTSCKTKTFRVEKNPAAEEATGFDFGESECADGLGIAGAEFQRVIGKAHRIFFAQTLRLLAINAVRHRHQILHNRLAKLLYIFLGVAVAAHAVVSQRGITFIAQLFAHFITQMHQLIVKIIQLSLVFFVPIALGFPCSEATGIVRVTLKRSELRKGVYTALKRDLSRSQQLFILIGQLIFFLQFFNNHRREGLALDFRLEEHQVAVLFGKVLTVRRFQHGLSPALLALLQLGVNLVPELHFSIIKSIASINGVANMGKIRQGADMLIQLFLCQEQFFRLSIAFRCFQLFSQAIQLSFQLLCIRALIFHLGKFHSEVLLVV